MRGWGTYAIGVVLTLTLSACRSSTTATPKPLPPAVSGPAATLQNREVLEGPLPVGAPLATTSESSIPAAATCESLARKGPAADETGYFMDEKRTACYRLGPNLLDGSNIVEVTASNDVQQNAWGVDVTYRSGSFIRSVAEPFVNRRVAIVVDGDVLSAPVINAGITGDVVRISGGFTEASARDLARRLLAGAYPAPAR